MVRKFYIYELNLQGCTTTEIIERFTSKDFRKVETKRELGPVQIYKGGIAKARSNIFLGSLYLVQIWNLPQKVNKKTGITSNLFSDEDDGLNLSATFLIDTENNILAFESLHTGPSEKCFCEIVEKALKGVKCELSFVLNLDALRKYRQMTDIKQIEVEVTNSVKRKIKREIQMNSITSMIKALQPTDFLTMNLKLTSSVGRNYLNLGEIRQLITSFLGDKKNVSKIRIKGRRGHDEKLESIDLLTDCKFLEINLHRQRNENHIYIGEKQSLLLEKYLEERDNIRTIVRN
ncbi:MAG TPA: DUF6731 family protein [Bacteroidia bacterium]|nr:DUF6731 family protein [Bacteroidia bacterium]